MTKNELVRELAEDFQLPRKQVAEMMEAILEKMTNVLKAGDKVQLTPFGQFKIRDRAARIARNPQTGEPVKVPAKRVLKFTAGKPLKEAVSAPRRATAAKKTTAVKKSAAPARKAAPAAKKTVAKKAVAKKTTAKKTTSSKAKR
jgi:DNA-binding protein HU-beta